MDRQLDIYRDTQMNRRGTDEGQTRDRQGTDEGTDCGTDRETNVGRDEQQIEEQME